MTNYIDGFILPIPSNRIDDYKKVVKQVADIWKEHGALDYLEFSGDDMNLEGTLSFNDLLSTSENETVIFGWVVFDSKESREIANKRVASDPRVAKLVEPLVDSSSPIFNASRMAFGGFKLLAKASD